MPHLNVSARHTAAELLQRAQAQYDRPGSLLPELARRASTGGFATGAVWMAAALSELRGRSVMLRTELSFHRLGVIKYAAATLAALIMAAGVLAFHLPILLPLAIPAFYTVEVQMVFLFPVALDGSQRPFRDARALMQRAGGTLRAMRIVIGLAGYMLFGGLLGNGYLRLVLRMPGSLHLVRNGEEHRRGSVMRAGSLPHEC